MYDSRDDDSTEDETDKTSLSSSLYYLTRGIHQLQSSHQNHLVASCLSAVRDRLWSVMTTCISCYFVSGFYRLSMVNAGAYRFYCLLAYSLLAAASWLLLTPRPPRWGSVQRHLEWCEPNSHRGHRVMVRQCHDSAALRLISTYYKPILNQDLSYPIIKRQFYGTHCLRKLKISRLSIYSKWLQKGFCHIPFLNTFLISFCHELFIVFSSFLTYSSPFQLFILPFFLL